MRQSASMMQAARVDGRSVPLAVAVLWVLTFSAIATTPATATAVEVCPIIPLPAEIAAASGEFRLTGDTVIRVPSADREALQTGRYLGGLLHRTQGWTLSVGAGAGPAARTGGAIVLRRVAGLAPEGYVLDIGPNGATISASTTAGLFYGSVSLWQLIPGDGAAPAIAAQTIRDAPSFAWRGLMLDSVRHFQSTAFIRTMIDWMAWHKLNVLHWHLTDDQGWRLEIRKYPRLTTVGAWRDAAHLPGTPATARYGGFYSQADVREIVAFAAERHVLIVPEIEMPGHAEAAIAAYPALGVRDATPVERAAPAERAAAVSWYWGVHTRLFNLDPAALKFLDDVLTEVIALFPGPYVHVGGDEAVKDEWNASPSIQAGRRRLGLPDSNALQAYFTQRMGRFLRSHGRRLVGWDEILQPGLDRGAVVMSWHGVAGAHDAAVRGNDAVLSPWPVLYLDNRQSALPGEPPGRLSVVSLQDIYGFDGFDPQLDAGLRHHILGVQADLWTEHIQSEDRVEWMSLPRAAAVAEMGWTPTARRSWPDFLRRLVPMFTRYAAFGLHYSDSVFAPSIAMTRSASGAQVHLSSQAHAGLAALGQVDVADIRYTVDGREPDAGSARYQVPLDLPPGTEIRAASFAGSTAVSHTVVRRLEAGTDLLLDSHQLQLCTEGIGLLLEPLQGAAHDGEPLAIDILNPCWIAHDVDLSAGPLLHAAVVPLPFNFEIGDALAKIRSGDAMTPAGELEVRVDGCTMPAVLSLPLSPAAASAAVTVLPAARLAPVPGRHDLCLRFARPRVDPLWALDWIRIGE